jgi:AbrB family looped-hinge helix DNA binding protein
MSATVVTLDERNQVTLPKDARRALGVQPGGRLLVVVENQRVYLLPKVENWTDYIYGLGEDLWADLGGGEQFLQEERAADATR